MSVVGPAATAEAVTLVTANAGVASSGPQTQTGRLVPDNVASGCDGPLKFSPSLTAPAQFHYTNHTFSSRLTQPVCVTAELLTACTGANAIFSVAYVGGFDPTNPLTRYAADIGSSPPASTPRSYSFAPGAGASFAIVVHEVNADQGCGAYTLTVTSDGPWADARPVITGSPAVGATITGTNATWKDTPAVERRWRRCDSAGGNCTDIPGATAATYTVTNADIGRTLRLRNNATDADGTNASESLVVEPFIPFRTQAGGSLAAGDRAQNGVFVRTNLESRCSAPTTAPTILQPASTFFYDLFPVTSLLNETVCLVARTTPACLDGVALAIYNPAFAPATGLAANYAGNSGLPFNQPGATSAPLSPGGAREITVSATPPGGTCAAYGVTLGADAPFATTRPAVSGSPIEGAAVTATSGAWSGSPALSRSWRRCDANGAACSPIAGATAASYTPTTADVGMRLRVRVTAAQGRAVSSDSAPSGVVARRLDRTAPRGTMRLTSRNLAKAVKTGRIPVRVACNEACSAVVEVRVTRRLAKGLRLRGKVVIARVKARVAAGRRRNLRVKLTSRARRALRRRKSLKVTVAASFTDAAGNRARRSLKRTLKRPRRR